jgi:hypothetical protein
LADRGEHENAQGVRAGLPLANQKHSRHPVAMLRWLAGARDARPLHVGLALLTAVACSSGKDTTAEQHAFHDDGGRQCRATLEKTSPNAPSVSESVSCEGEGKPCSAEARACFQLNVDDASNQVRNCPACCKGTASSFVSSECSALICEVDTDCVYARAQCQDGVCVCPNGICE